MDQLVMEAKGVGQMLEVVIAYEAQVRPEIAVKTTLLTQLPERGL